MEELSRNATESGGGEKREKEVELPPEAASVHETIRETGEKELSRGIPALFYSAVAAGLSMSFSMVATGALHAHLPQTGGAYLIQGLGYTVGFLMVILARQQLFTENTVTAVLPVMSRPRWYMLRRLLRLWGVVMAGNLLGVGAAALALYYLPLFDAGTDAAFIGLAHEVMGYGTAEMFSKGIFAGWLIAIMVWLVPVADQGKIWVILIMTYLIALGGFTHIIAGSTEIIYLVLAGEATWAGYLLHFALPTLLGNVLGGTLIFALISHAQIRADAVT